MTLPDALELRAALPDEYQRRARRAMAAHVRAMLDFQRAGAVVFDYGNNLRAQAQEAGVADAFDYPGFVPGVHPAAVLRGPRPVPVGGAERRPGRHRPHRPGRPRAVPRRRRASIAGSRWPRQRVPFQGLPARICWLGYGERHRAGLAFNELVRTGEVSAPDRHRARPPGRRLGRLTQPRDRSRCWTAPTPSPTGRCSTRSSTPRPGRPGCRSITAVASASGTRSMPGWSSSRTARTLAAQKLERVLTTDPAMGVLRHVDAGYEHAIEIARERGVNVPMLADD